MNTVTLFSGFRKGGIILLVYLPSYRLQKKTIFFRKKIVVVVFRIDDLKWTKATHFNVITFYCIFKFCSSFSNFVVFLQFFIIIVF